jgi:ABC-type transporter Mla MlaB component
MGAPEPQTIAFAICGPLARTDLTGLCDRACAVLASCGAEVALCDVSAAPADAVTVEALARLQLAARRHGCQARVCDASIELLQLVDFMGLGEVLPRGR